jgi:hypothetical protein
VIIYGVGIGFAIWNPMVGFGVYVAVAILWIVPDKKIEENVARTDARD